MEKNIANNFAKKRPEPTTGTGLKQQDADRINVHDETVKPPMVPVVVENIPPKLMKVSNWLNWEWSWKGKKWTKPPRNGTSTAADLTFKEALKNTELNSDFGLGLSIHENKYAALDLDGILNRKKRIRKKYRSVVGILLKSGAYVEISPSGRGLRVFGQGKFKTIGPVKGDHLEAYHKGRYLTVTGNPYPGMGKKLPKLEKLIKELVPILNHLKRKSSVVVGQMGRKGPFTEIAQKIWSVDPSSYDAWINIGMATHYETGGSEEGFLLWDLWSKGADNYGGTRARWEGFGDETENPVTIGTIRYLFNQSIIKGRDGFKLESYYTERTFMVDAFNKLFCSVLIDGKAVVAKMGRKKNIFLDKNSFLTHYGNIFIENEDDPDKPPKSAALMWLRSGLRNSAERVIFEPSLLPGLDEENDTLNMWCGLNIAKPSKKASWSLMQDHIKKVICSGNKKHYKYLIQWLAQIVQDPGGERPGVAVTLYGEKGTGKGTLGNWFGKLLGNYYAYCSSKDEIAGKYNGIIAQSVFVFADEAYFPGDKSVEGRLKSLITEPTITMEEKFIPRYQVSNHVHLLIASNEKWSVPATMDERRFFCLELSKKHQKDIPYFKALNEQMKKGGLEAMYHDLKRVHVKMDFLRTAPKTKQLQEQIESGEESHKAYFRALKERERMFPTREKDLVYKMDVYKDYLKFCNDRKIIGHGIKNDAVFWGNFYKSSLNFKRDYWNNSNTGFKANLKLNKLLKQVGI